MAVFRTFSQIVNSMIDRLRLTQVNLDTKQGTVSRDLFIDMQAEEFDRLYRTVSVVSEKQSPDSAVGRDLERWARNFGITKRPGGPSNGIIVVTRNELSSDIPIASGSTATARNGNTYSTIGNYIMSVAEKNKYAATANRLRAALDAAGISDQYALEVPVVASRAGRSGNIAPLQITNINIGDSVRVTNLTSFKDGSNLESDIAFKSRVFAIFSGSNTGTSAGYRNAALGVAGVLDAIVVEPGNTLMLRDGTETIEVDDGTFRILNSGTGGKVDLYILGNKLEEIVESFLYTDLSGKGDATDDRNDIIPGLSTTDISLTSEERRVQAFKTGNLPLQPVNSIVSLSGTGSGILVEKSVDANGNVSGNFELISDTNVGTGGSPFGFDRVRFISSTKSVESETISKANLNSIDAVRFSDIKSLEDVYEDISVTKENSQRSSTDRSIIQLNHYPIVTVDRIVNNTTGEVYVVVNQNIDAETGLNLDGRIKISGKTLPSVADILSVDYTWRLLYDGTIDYNGEKLVSTFRDDSVVDSIDWGISNGMFLETSVIEKTDDDLEFIVDVDYPVSRVISVFSAETTTASVVTVTTSENETVPGVELAITDSVISNIVSVKNSNGVELYSTLVDDENFSGRTIYFPSDTSAVIGETVTVFYNKIEFFNVSAGNGSYSNSTITLPSEDILTAEDVFNEVEDLYLTDGDVFVKYVAEIENMVPSQSLTSLPISGSSASNGFLSSTLAAIPNSNQPIFYNFATNGVPESIKRFGPTRLKTDVSGTTTAGRVKFTGTTLTRVILDVTAGISISGDTINLSTDLKSYLGISTIPSTLFIARVDSVQGLDTDQKYDIAGYDLNNNIYSFGTANSDTDLSAVEFKVPSTTINSNISFTSGEQVRVTFLLGNTDDFEELYFPGDGRVVTDKVFGKIDRVSVSSGFRSVVGTLVGSIVISPNSQPEVGLPYSTDYDFVAPKEGERLTLRYNLNRLISDSTVAVENVRSITADVLVKEAFDLPIDVSGEIVVNVNAETGTDTILENVANAVVNLLNSSTLGTTIDYSDIVSVAASISGVDSVNISLFNESGKTGRRTFVKALDNQYLSSGSIKFTAISRKDFRIT